MNQRLPHKCESEKQSEESLEKNHPPSMSLEMIDADIDTNIDQAVAYATSCAKDKEVTLLKLLVLLLLFFPRLLLEYVCEWKVYQW